MKRIKILYNKIVHGIPEPEITQNPSVRRKMDWHGPSYTLIDKEWQVKLGRYAVYK